MTPATMRPVTMPGTTNDAGDDASGDNTACTSTKCGVDQPVSVNTCTACKVGSTNSNGDDDASGDDTTCACAANERLVSNASLCGERDQRRGKSRARPGHCVQRARKSASSSSSPTAPTAADTIFGCGDDRQRRGENGTGGRISIRASG